MNTQATGVQSSNCDTVVVDLVDCILVVLASADGTLHLVLLSEHQWLVPLQPHQLPIFAPVADAHVLAEAEHHVADF